MTSTRTTTPERSMGALIGEMRGLSPQEIEQVATYQRKHSGVRFGEAAVALRLASSDDVLHALSRQFRYAYSPDLLLGDTHSELVVASNPFSDEAEAFRELRSQLMVTTLGKAAPRRALAVLSPDVGDGKSYIAANLAVAFSQLGARTVLVDADMRTPRQHRLFALEDSSGLSNVLSGRTADNVMHAIKDLPNLHVMPVGVVPPNPQELVQGPTFGLLLAELLTKFDHVVVDTPAAAHGADARIIAAVSGAALVVGRKGRSRMAAMQGLLKQLSTATVAVAGVVMNEY